jgi:hypothetical protein
MLTENDRRAGDRLIPTSSIAKSGESSSSCHVTICAAIYSDYADEEELIPRIAG